MDRITAAEVFMDVTRSGSFTATAERLRMSRPMVTRHVEAMETWFGSRLLHRTTRRVTLTTVGEQCVANIESWLLNTQQLVSGATPSLGLSDSVKIATSVSFGHAQLMPAVSQFMSYHPKVSIAIDLGDSVADLVDNRIDLAIRIATDPDPSLIGKPIALCHTVMTATQTYLDSQPAIVEPSDLSHHQCLTHANYENQVWHLSQGDQNASVCVKSRLSANEATVLLKAALCDVGIARLPTYLVKQELADGRLINVLPQWQAAPLSVYALYSSRKFLSPTVRALIDFLAEYFQQHPWD